MPSKPQDEAPTGEAGNRLSRMHHPIHRQVLKTSGPPSRGSESVCYAHGFVALLIYEEKSMNKWMGFQWG